MKKSFKLPMLFFGFALSVFGCFRQFNSTFEPSLKGKKLLVESIKIPEQSDFVDYEKSYWVFMPASSLCDSSILFNNQRYCVFSLPLGHSANVELCCKDPSFDANNKTYVLDKAVFENEDIIKEAKEAVSFGTESYDYSVVSIEASLCFCNSQFAGITSERNHGQLFSYFTEMIRVIPFTRDEKRVLREQRDDIIMALLNK